MYGSCVGAEVSTISIIGAMDRHFCNLQIAFCIMKNEILVCGVEQLNHCIYVSK